MKSTTVTSIQMGNDNTIAAITVTTVSETDDDFGPYGLGRDDDDPDDDSTPETGPRNKLFVNKHKEN